MDEYTMQSYFKTLSNAYCIAYEQMERLKKEDEEISKLDRTDELDELKKLQSLDITVGVTKKYLSSDFSKERLADIQSQLEKEQQDYEERQNKLDAEYAGWRKRKEELDALIREAIITIKENGFHIIVMSKEQIIALLCFFVKNNISNYKVINTEEEFLQSFPVEEEWYQDFFEAYCLEDYILMSKLYKEKF